jgi:nitroimidazol reductase NimA-like FMN-containing flavoprotein (pyridoxamine 5'-phosphate oxidase superfamily)
MAADRRPVTISEIPRDECEQLLASHAVGRLALVVDGQPHILPVNYAVAGHGEVVFRTAAGSALTEASLRSVAFEVDAIDADAHEGWSVVVVGYCRDIADAIDAASVAMRGLPLETWAPGERDQWFKIVPTDVTGRRIAPA